MTELLPAIKGNPGRRLPETGKDVTGARRVCYVPSDPVPRIPDGLLWT